jgi:hypothetical protein
MSNIAEAREWLQKAYDRSTEQPVKAFIRRALNRMFRDPPSKPMVKDHSFEWTEAIIKRVISLLPHLTHQAITEKCKIPNSGRVAEISQLHNFGLTAAQILDAKRNGGWRAKILELQEADRKKKGID